MAVHLQARGDSTIRNDADGRNLDLSHYEAALLSFIVKCSMREKYTSILFKLLLMNWAFVLVTKVGIWNYKGKPALFYFPQVCFSWPFFNSLVQLFLLFLVALIVDFNKHVVPW